jgi:hypothetical protein
VRFLFRELEKLQSFTDEVEGSGDEDERVGTGLRQGRTKGGVGLD